MPHLKDQAQVYETRWRGSSPLWGTNATVAQRRRHLLDVEASPEVRVLSVAPKSGWNGRVPYVLWKHGAAGSIPVIPTIACPQGGSGTPNPASRVRVSGRLPIFFCRCTPSASKAEGTVSETVQCWFESSHRYQSGCSSDGRARGSGPRGRWIVTSHSDQSCRRGGTYTRCVESAMPERDCRVVSCRRHRGMSIER